MARPCQLAWRRLLSSGLSSIRVLATSLRPVGPLGIGPRLLAIALLATGCAFEMPPADPPSPSREQFDAEVYPLLLRDCGFTGCHGSRDRFFRVFGPGRRRLDDATGIDAAPTEAELAEAYERARSMLAAAHAPEDALLLRKPLELDVGGAPHRGIDTHGQDVYASPEDDGYQLLLRWARTGFPEP